MPDILSQKIHELANDLSNEKLVPKELEAMIPPALLAEAKSLGLDVFGIDASSLLTGIAGWAVSHINLIFKILRIVKPVLVVGSFGLVTRYDDVLNTLEQDDVFATTNLEQLRKVAGNDFILGMANTPDYTRDHTNLRAVIRRSDIPTRVGEFAEAAAAGLIADAKGALDIVPGLTQAVTAAWVGDYFGTPGPDATTLVQWCVDIFNFLTIPPGTDPDGERAGLVAGQKFQAYVSKLIAERHTKPGPDDTLSRFMTLQATQFPGLSDDRIKSNIVGMVSGAIPPMATMAAIAMDQLLSRPTELAAAQEAARAGDAMLVGSYVNEAMRFSPIGPGVLRVTTRDFVVGRGRGYATTIVKGTTVMVATQSALFDDALFSDPDDFRIDRDEYNFLLYGSGMHNCFGKYIASTLMPRMLMPLLAQQNLRRAQGPAGQLTKSGVQATGLTLNWKAALETDAAADPCGG